MQFNTNLTTLTQTAQPTAPSAVICPNASLMDTFERFEPRLNLEDDEDIFAVMDLATKEPQEGTVTQQGWVLNLVFDAIVGYFGGPQAVAVIQGMRLFIGLGKTHKKVVSKLYRSLINRWYGQVIVPKGTGFVKTFMITLRLADKYVAENHREFSQRQVYREFRGLASKNQYLIDTGRKEFRKVHIVDDLNNLASIDIGEVNSAERVVLGPDFKYKISIEVGEGGLWLDFEAESRAPKGKDIVVNDRIFLPRMIDNLPQGLTTEDAVEELVKGFDDGLLDDEFINNLVKIA